MITVVTVCVNYQEMNCAFKYKNVDDFRKHWQYICSGSNNNHPWTVLCTVDVHIWYNADRISFCIRFKSCAACWHLLLSMDIPPLLDKSWTIYCRCNWLECGQPTKIFLRPVGMYPSSLWIRPCWWRLPGAPTVRPRVFGHGDPTLLLRRRCSFIVIFLFLPFNCAIVSTWSKGRRANSHQLRQMTFTGGIAK